MRHMRDQHAIEQELEVARRDLEQTLARLKTVVLDKIDIKAKAHRAVERGKHRASMGLDRVERTASRLAVRTVTLVRTHPWVTVAIVTGVAVLGGVLVRSRVRARRYSLVD